jgi:hypothetical protein
MEVANAASQRDLVYERVNGAVLTIDLYSPEKVSGPLPVLSGFMAEGGAKAVKKDTVRRLVW